MTYTFKAKDKALYMKYQVVRIIAVNDCWWINEESYFVMREEAYKKGGGLIFSSKARHLTQLQEKQQK